MDETGVLGLLEELSILLEDSKPVFGKNNLRQVDIAAAFDIMDEIRDTFPSEFAQARQIAMYLSKQHTKAPLTAIGAAIGGKNHATVLHACKAISNLMETDKLFRYQVEEIEKKVLAR